MYLICKDIFESTTRFIFHPEMLKIEYSKMFSIRIHFTYIQTRGLWIYYNCVNQWKVFCAVLLQIASLIKLTKNNLLCMSSCITLRPTAYKREYLAFSIRKSLKMLQGKWRANPIFLVLKMLLPSCLILKKACYCYKYN